MSDRAWSIEPPQTPGFYWLYGDVHHGGMGIDYRDDKPPTKPDMVLVEVFKISNGVMAKSGGHIVPTEKFDIKTLRPGPLGYWSPAELPEPPKDEAGLFKAGPLYKPEP